MNQFYFYNDGVLFRSALTSLICIVLIMEQIGISSQTTSVMVRYDGCQVWRVYTKDKTDYNVVKQIEREFGAKEWGVDRNYTDLMIFPKKLKAVAEALKKFGLKHEVNLKDVQKTIEGDEFNIEKLLNYSISTRMSDGLISFSNYNNLSVIYDYLENLVKLHPFCKIIDIGRSAEGVPLKVLHISRGTAYTAAWIESGVHGREWSTISTGLYIVERMVNDAMTANHDILDVDLYFLIVANPDGYKYSYQVDRLWEKNRRQTNGCVGVNLSRNYGLYFEDKKKNKEECDDDFKGPSPFSEPETIAVKDFFQNVNANFSAFITFHSYGQYILYPWGSNSTTAPSDSKDLQKVAERAAIAIYNLTGVEYVVGADATIRRNYLGSSIDWAKGVQLIKYTYIIELRDQGSYGFLVPTMSIMPSARDGYAAFRAIMDAVAPFHVYMSKSSSKEALSVFVWITALLCFLMNKITNFDYYIC